MLVCCLQRPAVCLPFGLQAGQARGLPGDPVRFAQLVPGQTWQGLQYFHRLENCIVEGGQVGARYHSITAPGFIDNCILQNNDNFIGCGGNFDTYGFTEDRSVCSCNGPKLAPCSNPAGTRDCFSTGGGNYWSSRAWRRDGAFTDSPGDYDKTEWHFVEAYFEMNSINGGVAQTDGKIRWVQDGEVLITCDEVLMRTNTHANLAFDQFAMLPYIGPPGSPSAQPQSFFVDELTVATARP